MSYKIQLAKSVAERIRATLSSLPYGYEPARDEFIKAMNRLAQDNHLGSPILSGEFKGRMGFSFRIDRPPMTWSFTIVYEYSCDETTLHVVEFGERQIMHGPPPVWHPRPPSEDNN